MSDHPARTAPDHPGVYQDADGTLWAARDLGTPEQPDIRFEQIFGSAFGLTRRRAADYAPFTEWRPVAESPLTVEQRRLAVRALRYAHAHATFGNPALAFDMAELADHLERGRA